MLGCTNPGWIGDGYCDDVTNNMECNYDGGDCCLYPVNTQYCSECQCISEGGSTEDAGTTGLTGGTTASPSGTLQNPNKNQLQKIMDIFIRL